MNLSATLANTLWVASSLPAVARFRRALHHPAETQWQVLQENLSRNAGSDYGRAHGFDGIESYAGFARRVPLVAYEELEPWIARILRGERRVLTTEPVSHLIPTSGSSGARKLIPFTVGLQREFNRAIGAWIADLYVSEPSLACGSSYWSITPATMSSDGENPVVPIGFEDDSAYLGGFRKRLVDAALAVPAALRHVTDMKSFRYLTLLCLARQDDLRLISIWHPSFLTLLLDMLPGYWETLMRDLHDGSCRGAEELPANVRDALRLRRMARRAAQLSKADPTRPATLWPSLKVISCWGDAHAGLATADLQRRFPGTFIQRKGLLATEAFVSLPCSGSWPLAITSHFFEFIDGTGRIHLAHELKEREQYEVVVTTSGGLYRYQLRDLVEVTGFLGRTPSLRFLGRAGKLSDRFGEKLSETFVAETLEKLLSASAASPRFALLAPEDSEAGCCYALYLEGNPEIGLFARLDELLRQNPNYGWCRELGQLQPPRVFRIRNGGYEQFAARELARGKRLGEIKPCALSLDTDWADCFDGEYLAPSGSLEVLEREERGA